MGQQQLLLLVLGIVIVGLVVVVGIQAFGENQKKANADAITNDVIRIASDAQAWALKPAAFGGGNGSFVPTGGAVTLAKLGYEVTGSVYGNLNGTYTLNSATTGGTASVNSTMITIVGCSLKNKNLVTSLVKGTGPSDIGTTVAPLTATACPTS